MSDTHQEVTRVWIDPGCIVCDACETDCPEVFEVQEETCIIRPEATKADFNQLLTPHIRIAADNCPVDVIKFETVEVEGPEPEAWKEAAAAPAEAAVGAGNGASPGAGAAAAISRDPPDPKWLALLESAHVSGSRSAGGPVAVVRPARVPAEAIKRSLPLDAPPDAQFATMVGTGYVKPTRSMAQRIRDRAAALSAAHGVAVTRRGFAFSLWAGWASMVFVGGTFLAWLQSFMVPKAPIQKASKVRVGKLLAYTELGVYEQYKKEGIWIISLEDEGERKIVAISTTCTHLGCIPNWMSGAQIFKCPCHGSGFRMTGINFEGPAPRPLERYALDVDEAGVLIVDKSKVFRYELGQWSSPEAFRTFA